MDLSHDASQSFNDIRLRTSDTPRAIHTAAAARPSATHSLITHPPAAHLTLTRTALGGCTSREGGGGEGGGGTEDRGGGARLNGLSSMWANDSLALTRATRSITAAWTVRTVTAAVALGGGGAGGLNRLLRQQLARSRARAHTRTHTTLTHTAVRARAHASTHTRAHTWGLDRLVRRLTSFICQHPLYLQRESEGRTCRIPPAHWAPDDTPHTLHTRTPLPHTSHTLHTSTPRIPGTFDMRAHALALHTHSRAQAPLVSLARTHARAHTHTCTHTLTVTSAALPALKHSMGHVVACALACSRACAVLHRAPSFAPKIAQRALCKSAIVGCEKLSGLFWK